MGRSGRVSERERERERGAERERAREREREICGRKLSNQKPKIKMKPRSHAHICTIIVGGHLYSRNDMPS